MRTFRIYHLIFKKKKVLKNATRRSILLNYIPNEGTVVAQRLRCCATNQKVTGLIPDGVIGIFH